MSRCLIDARVGLFVSSSGNYLPFLNAFLNSLEKQAALLVEAEVAVPVVYLVHWEMSEEYLQAVSQFEHIRVVPVEVKDEDLQQYNFLSRVERCKAGRYYYMKEISRAQNLEVACLMDCDLMVVNPEFFNLFEFVHGTNLLIGCNERFKWDVGPDKYTQRDGKTPLFPHRRKLMKFHCNTPLFLGQPYSEEWQTVLDTYLNIVYQAHENHPKKGRVTVGDIFAWNFAVALCELEHRVTLFPMSVMTQVHQTAYKKWTELKCKDGYYYTYAGDPVLSLHGRCGKKDFGRFNPDKIDSSKGKLESVNQMYRREWYDLNFRQKLVLTDFCPMKDHWKQWLKKHHQ